MQSMQCCALIAGNKMARVIGPGNHGSLLKALLIHQHDSRRASGCGWIESQSWLGLMSMMGLVSA